MLYYLIFFSGGTAISLIIIDGYNLIGIQHRDLQKQRETLIQQLITYKKIKGHDITVVFDGWKAGGRLQEQIVAGGVRVIYSRLGERADEVIRKMIGQDGKEWIVITSDREIMNHAWSCGSVPVQSDQFLRRLEQSFHLNHPQPLPGKEGSSLSADDSKGDIELTDDDEMPQKGNPRQLSKKEKTLLRVLNKL